MSNVVWTEIQCEVCGRVIGKTNGKDVHVKHKGREVRCLLPCSIVCDKNGCKHENILRRKKKET